VRIDEVLVHLLALATGVVLFIGLAHALDGSRGRPRLRARVSRHVPLEDLYVPLSERRALASRSITLEPLRRLAPEPVAAQAAPAIDQVQPAAAQLELVTEQPERPPVETTASAPVVADPLPLTPVLPVVAEPVPPSLTPDEAISIEASAASNGAVPAPESLTEPPMDEARAFVIEPEAVIEAPQPKSQPPLSKAQEIQARLAALIDRQQFARGLALAKEALGRHDGSNPEREVLSDMLWTSAAGEVGRLIGQALRNGARGEGGSERALAKMDAAEAVVDAVPGSVLTSARRQDVGRRLWWGYMKLGTGRLDAGDLDGAIEPLFRALRLGELDPERQIETRQSLARAVEGLVDQLGVASLERLREGDFDGAMAESRRLSQVLDGGLERGLSQEDLASAIGRRHEILTQIAAS